MSKEVNILEDIKWMITTDGLKTPKEVFLEGDTIQLSQEVTGYVYGAQYRFLMTIFPLLARVEPENVGGRFSVEAIDEVFQDLSQYSKLFSNENPFLQVDENILTEEDGELVEVDLSKAIPDSKLPGKLLPTGLTALNNQSIFWNFENLQDSLSTEELVLALLVYYFYGVGGNTWLSRKDGKSNKSTKLSNGTSALRFLNSVEIIPQGENLMASLALSTPKNFLEFSGEKLLPHWADRAASTMSIEDPLWQFSWSSNTVKLFFNDDDEVVAVGRGGNPELWRPIPHKEKDPWHGKTYHDFRSEKDPLYFYRIPKTNPSKDNAMEEVKPKLWRNSLSSDPYFTVTQWYSEDLASQLVSKLDKNFLDSSELEDFIFLEHNTEGSSNSFNVRYSKVFSGWRDELLVDEEKAEELQILALQILGMKKVLMKLLYDGECKHLSARQDDLENFYWGEIQSLVMKNLEGEEEFIDNIGEIRDAAVRAFEKVSSNRNTIHINAHLRALNELRGWKYKP